MLLWNEGDGKFREGARAAGVDAYGWRTGAAVGDVNGDGWPDIFVAGYADMNSDNPAGTRRVPEHQARRPRRPLPLERGTTARSRSGRSGGRPASRSRGSSTGSERSSPTSRATATSTCISRTTRTPTACTKTSSGRAGRKRIPRGWASGSRSVRPRGGRRPGRRYGRLGGGLQRGRALRSLRHERARPGTRRVQGSSPARPERPTPTYARTWPRRSPELGRLGRDLGRPRPRRRSRSLARERGIPVTDLAADAQPLEAYVNKGAQSGPRAATRT